MEHKEIIVALAGNPNSGKTSIFNNLTGAHQYIGNWPGVTVERKSGEYNFNGYKFKIIDLPGIYSLSSNSLDEKVAVDFLLKEKPDVVVVIVDSTNIERNFYLLTQLLEMEMNIVVDLNMIDLLNSKGIKIDDKKLSLILDLPIVKTNARDNLGVDKLKTAILNSALRKINTKFNIKYRKVIENKINEIVNVLKDKGVTDELIRWKVLEVLQGNESIMNEISKKYDFSGLQYIVLDAITEIEKEIDDDVSTAIIEDKYAFIQGLVKECITREMNVVERYDISNRIDKIVTNRFIGIPLFLLLMWGMFELVFVIGNPLADLLNILFVWFGNATGKFLAALSTPGWLNSLVVNGIIGGVGSVIVFLPNILILFVYISLLEDSGYMARAAFVMDKLMHKLGLHGKSFIPMILGFGCNVPAIMAARTLEKRKDRILTILAIPYISCSARLPIYILFTGAFFKKSQGSIVFALYMIGIIIAIGISRFFKAVFFKHEVAPLIMELPPYRIPKLKFAFIHSWRRGKMFLQKAGTVIIAAAIIIWVLASFPIGAEYASESSYIGVLGKAIAPIFKLAGFGFWQASVAVIMGVMAKEIVVGTFGTLFGAEGAALVHTLPHYFTALSAFSFMLMSLIYIPCIATIAAIKREAGTRWAIISVTTSLILGWVLSTLFYQIASLF